MNYNVGRHTFRHADIMSSYPLETIIPQVDLVYSDPPWGQSALKMFETMNQKDTGSVPPENNNDEFLARVFDVYMAHSKNLVMLEYSIRMTPRFVAVAESRGLHLIGKAEWFYGSKPWPNYMLVFSKQPYLQIPDSYYKGIKGLGGYQAVYQAIKGIMEYADIKTVFDPCCGLGHTAKASHELGLTFYGIELNEKRLKGAMKKVA